MGNAEPELYSPQLQSPYQKNLLKLYAGKNRGSVDVQTNNPRFEITENPLTRGEDDTSIN